MLKMDEYLCHLNKRCNIFKKKVIYCIIKPPIKKLYIKHKSILMRKGYLHSVNSVSELQLILGKMNKANVDLENIVINEELNSFVNSLQDGDCMVVYSLDIFGSILELLNFVTDFENKGIKIESISDEWFNDYQSSMPVLRGLNDVGRRMVGIRTKKGLGRAKASGKKLGRPFGTTTSSAKIKEVDRIRSISNVTIKEACEMADCQPRTYYRHVKKRLGKV